MERAFSRHGLDRLAGHIHGNEDALVMQPLRGEGVIVRCPFRRQLHFGFSPQRRFLKDGEVGKLVLGQHASPFRRAP
jgi:hypothetical protein